MRTTYMAKPNEVDRKWYVVDAAGKPLGRVASQVAAVLRGKNKPTFTPNVDCGDYVIVINADKVRFTGKKFTDKVYVRHTGYPGGQRFSTPKEIMAKFPVRVIEHAVKGMLPKNRLGSKMYRNLHVVAGSEHKFEAQQPKLVNLNSIR